MFDVLVVGSGPAGAAIAAACAHEQLHTALLAPDHGAAWPATYAAWADELPADLPPAVRAATVHGISAIGTRPHRLDRPYVVLDNAGLRRHLHHPRVERRTGLATSALSGPHGCTVRLVDGGSVAASVVIDASGARRTLCGGPARPPATEQAAVGFFVPADAASAVLDGADAVLMDWRWPPADAIPAPSFLYAVPTGPDTVLLEETSLAQRPGLPRSLLRRRLRARLAAHGIGVSVATGEEHVRFPVDTPLPGPGRVVAFGVAAGVQHPATGYSVATTLALAPRVAAAIAQALPAGPLAAAAAGRRAVWSRKAVAVHALRRRGLAVLLALPPDGVPLFFDAFFELPEPLRRAYLSERENMAGITTAMAALFAAVPWSMRARLLELGIGLGRPWYRS